MKEKKLGRYVEMVEGSIPRQCMAPLGVAVVEAFVDIIVRQGIL